MHQPRLGAPHLRRHPEGAEHEVSAEHVVHRPPNGPPLEDVEHDAEVEPGIGEAMTWRAPQRDAATFGGRLDPKPKGLGRCRASATGTGCGALASAHRTAR